MSARVLTPLVVVLLLTGCRTLSAAATAAAGPIALQETDRILVLAPHPDDEVLGAGGVLRESVRRKLPVRVVFLTHGDSNEWSFLAYRKRPVLTPSGALAMGAVRHQEALAAAKVLGVDAQDLRFLGYPDYGTLDIWRAHWGSQAPARGRLTRARAVPYSSAFRPGAPYKGEAILADLETILKDFRPTQIFVSHPADHHPDHAALYLFTRVALWDVQKEVTAAVHPYLVHYPGWPRIKGPREQDALTPPPSLLTGFRWQSRELPPDDIAVKRKALAEHRTQFGYSSARLLPFVRPNELFGDLIVPTLAASGNGAVDLEGLTVRRVGGQLEVGMQLRQPLNEISAVSLSACGYRQDVPFAAMPKLEIQVRQHAWKVSDQGVALPRTAASGNVQDRRLTARIPLASLKDPSRLFLQVRTGSRRSALGQTPWWIVEIARP